ncbi:DNA polymerase I [Candidatus Uhrbacteria bacterium]|nr:MAG: DNA polymerase I [Candidatus Uhrbacteria bacterium]
MKRLFILDANSLLHRTWHAIRPLTNPEGLVVNCVYGMLMSVLKLIEREKPDAFVACWDTEAATFRHDAYEAYKAQRKTKEDELYAQIPWVKEGFEALGIDSLAVDGYEADDLIGTLAKKAKKSGWEVVIVTGDRDALQLLEPGVRVMAFLKGVTDTKLYDEWTLKEEYGLTTQQFLEYKAMRGDPSDNIPGIKGIGEKGAKELLLKYGTLNKILQAAHDPSSELTPSTRQKLLSAEAELPFIVKLVKIVTNAPVKWTPKKTTFPRDREAFLTFLHRMGFRSLVARMNGEKQETKTVVSTRTPSKKDRKALPPALHSADTFEEKRLTKSSELGEALKDLKRSDAVAVFVPEHPQRSLFVDTGSGLVFAGNHKAFHVAADLANTSVIREFLADEDVPFVAHDAKSELRKLEAYGLVVGRWNFDTMLAAYLLGAGERNHDLDALAATHLGVQLESDAPPTSVAETVCSLVRPLRAKLREESLEHVFERFELPLVQVLRDMEREGILIDRAYLKSLSKQMSAAKVKIEEKMRKTVGKEFNPASPTQLADILFSHLGLPTKGVKRGKKGYSTAAPELEKLRGTHPIIEMIEEYREVSKLLSTYVDVLPDLADKTGRVHTTFNQAVTATGRLSSTEPNLQNIPIRTELGRKIRRAFIAKRGYKLLSCDYSQIELRIVALLAKDQNMLDAFKRGEDIHTATAAKIWEVPLKAVTKEQRRIAKAINFGLIFGQGAQGLAQVAGISFSEAKEFIRRYFEVYRGVKEYMDQTKALAHSLGYVETLFGRRRYLPEIHSQLAQVRAQAERMAINMPVQGTDADLMKLAMIAIHEKLPAICADAKMLLQVHDELLFEVPNNKVQAVAEFVRDVMQCVEKLAVPIVVDVKTGENWEEMEAV